MTSNLRLFAGLTSFMSNLCLSHFCAMGPEGIFESRAILLHGLLSVMKHQNGYGDGDVSDKNQPRDEPRAGIEAGAVDFVLPAERLKHGAHAVAQVKAKQGDADDVKY